MRGIALYLGVIFYMTPCLIMASDWDEFIQKHGDSCSLDGEVLQFVPSKIRIERFPELHSIITSYKENGKPIALAVACGQYEIPFELSLRREERQNFMMKELHPPIQDVIKPNRIKESWVALDLLLTDNNLMGGPHVRMDAGRENHWCQIIEYLKEKRVEISTIAMTAYGPDYSSRIVKNVLWPLLHQGGRIIYPHRVPLLQTDDMLVILTQGRFSMWTPLDKSSPCIGELVLQSQILVQQGKEGLRKHLLDRVYKDKDSPTLNKLDAYLHILLLELISGGKIITQEELLKVLTQSPSSNLQAAIKARKKEFIEYYKQVLGELGFRNYKIYGTFKDAEALGLDVYQKGEEGYFPLDYKGSGITVVLEK